MLKTFTNEDFCSFIILSSYLLNINLKKLIIMSCGCKNKGNQTPQQQPVQQPTQQPTQTNSIQESIRKVVEKYYKK